MNKLQFTLKENLFTHFAKWPVYMLVRSNLVGEIHVSDWSFPNLVTTRAECFFLYQLLFLKATTVFHTCVLCEKFDYVLGTRFETVPILELLS